MYPTILISGKMASGKSTLAKELVKHSYATISISTSINKVARFLIEDKHEELYKYLLRIVPAKASTMYAKYIEIFTTGFLHKEWVPNGEGFYVKTDDYRKLLQTVANMMRSECSDESIWVHIMVGDHKESIEKGNKIICDDVRFPLEKETLEQVYGFKSIRLDIDSKVQLARLKTLYNEINESQLTHNSETALDNASFDLRIDNSRISAKTLTATVLAFLGSFAESENILTKVVQLSKNLPLGKRDNWEEYFMSIAYIISLRSSCGSRRVGALLIDGLEEGKRHIVATGYNGYPGGAKHCIDGGCPRFQAKQQGLIQSGDSFNDEKYPCHAFHAEHNVINQILDSNNRSTGGILFTTTYPCISCARLIHGGKIKKIYYCEGYPDRLSEQYLKDYGITTVKLNVGL